MSQVENRVLVLAPLGADAANIRDVLVASAFEVELCRDLAEVAEKLSSGCGAILMTEEAVDTPRHPLLASALAQQLPWSDVPVVLITTGGRFSALSTRAIHHLGERANLTLIERPLRTLTLVAALKTALRARRRQYEVRDLLADRERLLSSLEERVAERTARLRLMVEELEAFSYSVSHDLRAPLRVLDGYAHVLVEDFGASLPPRAQDMLDRISRAARRMDRLTQDVLAYTRVTRAELTLEPLDLDLVFRAVIEQYPSLLSARQFIRIHSPLGHAQGHLPSLIQCFSNLLENALKFVPEGVSPDVEIYAEPTGDRLRVVIRDHGIGIDPSQHQRIFGIFERAASSRIPGTGIGLAIVKKAVERMGGVVGVSSAPGQGARFWVELHSAPVDAEPAPATPAHAVPFAP